ncbi:ATP-binding protein [Paraburkholderia diazotrophica]|uniref:ATP-binding protein n=1 Tax=Paraburkholderia diazotrophica TaxID=667676 RepID=UPI0031803EA7
MERLFASGQDSPLEMLRMLERNLKRERRIFSVAVGLLIIAALSAALVTALTLVNTSLKREQESVHLMTTNVNAALGAQQAMLTTGRLLLELSGQGLLGSPVSRSGDRCVAWRRDHSETRIQFACDEAVQLLARSSRAPTLQFGLLDASASYGYGFFSADANVREPNGEDRLAILSHWIKATMAARDIDQLDAVRERRTMWFKAPPSLGFHAHTFIAFSIVAKDDQPYAFVATRIDLDRVVADSIPESMESDAALFDPQGELLAGDAAANVFYAEKHLRPGPTGVFRWIPGHGWGARSQSLIYDIGHIVLSLPVYKDLAARRTEAFVILVLTLALVGLLLAMYRYWNYRYLTRTYDQACLAVEGEILNHLLVHATPVGLCIVLRYDFRIIAANQIARTVLDLGETPTRLPLGLCEAFEKRGILPTPTRSDAGIEQFEYSQPRPGADDLHLKIAFAPAVVNKTDVLFCAIADITEQHEVERLLRAAKETSDNMAKAKLNFFASMSHEIRTPLASLVGNLELVALGPLAAEQAARVQTMQASAGALLQVVNDVLDFSKMDIGEMRLAEEWSGIRELILRVMAAHAPLANRQGLKLFVVIDRECPERLLFDPIRVSQILNNLLGNALKFTHFGKIVVRADWRDAALQLSVADTGVGIPDELRQRLFQPFTQGEGHRLTQARGTGLGLSICARLCELMRGRIAVESIEGVGTRIVVSLPLRSEAPAAPVDEPLAGHPAVLCRASEYREWFDGLADPRAGSSTYVDVDNGVTQLDGCDYLIATDEFSAADIARVWQDASRVIRMTQDGPLVPVIRDDGSLEVSIFSLRGFRQAVQSLMQGPHAKARLFEPAARERAARAQTNEMPAVLVAEDNLLNRGLLRDQLLTLGAKVIEAADGEEALALLGKLHVDIVLTDMDMPKMTGAELLSAIRANDPDLPVYAVSASASAQDVEQGRAQGFTDYLTKPVALSVLAAVLATTPETQYETSSDDDADDELPPRFPAVPPAYVRTIVQQTDLDLAALHPIRERHDTQALRHWAHRVSGGLSVLGPSMLHDQCQELRAAIRESGNWSEDVETFVSIVQAELTELRDLHMASLHD